MLIAGFLKNSFIDYPAKISAVVFTAGCNFDCHYCHNNKLIDFHGEFIDEQNVLSYLETRIGFLDGVVISGGEPTLQKDLIDFIKKIKSMNYLVKLDTNGTNPDMLNNLIEQGLVDYVAMDIKAPLEKYEQIIMQPTCLDNIKKSRDLLLQNKVDYEFRTTLSPKLSFEDVVQIGKEIMGAKTFYLQKCNLPNYLDNNFNNDLLKQIENILKNYIKIVKIRGF